MEELFGVATYLTIYYALHGLNMKKLVFGSNIDICFQTDYREDTIHKLITGIFAVDENNVIVFMDLIF